MLATVTGFIESVWIWLTDLVMSLGYPGITALMAIESSFIPFPSEVVMPPAGALARDGQMSLPLVLCCGVAGSLLGALFNYWFALKVGRPFCLRYGKYFFLPEKKFHRAEAFFLRHGEITTFVCRLLPGIRQVISVPAGLVRMPLLRFIAFTTLGSALWVTVLTLVGYALGLDLATKVEIVKRHSYRILIYMGPALLLLIAGYVVWCRRRRRAAPAPTEGSECGPSSR